jgi:hypothetical protein
MTEPLLAPSAGHQDYNSTTQPTMAVPARRAYPGQDNRQTSKRELRAWYSYCFASEVYAVVSLSTPPTPSLADSSDVHPRDVGTARFGEGRVVFGPHDTV